MALWPRREQFEFFSGVDYPFYSVTFNLDVTGLYRYVKAHGLSFYYALVHLSTRAINSVEAFHYGMEDGQVVRYDRRVPSFTDLRPGSENFHIVEVLTDGTLAEFCAAAKAASAARTGFIDPDSQGEHLIYLSCLPWVDLTAATNERNFDPDDAIPRLTWGKYREENGRKVLGYSVDVNHRFIDGLHIGKFAMELERLINEL